MGNTPFIPCDQCRKRSEVVYVNGPDEWDFCGHHGRDHHDKMTELGFTRILLSDDCDSDAKGKYWVGEEGPELMTK